MPYSEILEWIMIMPSTPGAVEPYLLVSSAEEWKLPTIDTTLFLD